MKRRHYLGYILAVVLLAMVVAAVLNRQWIYDFVRGVSYAPSSEMVRIRDDLKLTGRGEFLFNAAQPMLSESDEFNVECGAAGAENAVLGCYTEGNIYVYNITEVELNGIRELTTAHELLHAVWARMNEDERRELTAALTRVFEDNQEFLEDEITTYDINERQEELYVRAGTEVADLPEELEQHYAEIFTNQDAVVAFYENYIGVFREIEIEMEQLMSEMEAINTEMETMTVEYERRAAQLNADIISFNSCAAVAGCFQSEAEFSVRRGQLLTEQANLVGMYEEINRLVSEYNARVEEYNKDVTRSIKLNRAINSNSRPEELK